MPANLTPAEIEQLLQLAAEEQATLGRVTRKTSDRLDDLANNSKKYADQMSKDLKDLGNAFLNIARDRLAGDTKLSTYNQSIIASGNLIGNALSTVPLFGKALKVGADLAAQYVKTALTQADELYASYQEMARAGATGSDGIKGLYDNMQKLGYGIQELSTMTRLVRDNSETLAGIGATANAGVDVLAEVSMGMRRSGTGYRLLTMGKSVDDLNVGAAGYLKLQHAYGLGSRQTVDQLSIGSAQYVEKLSLWAKVTGTSEEDIIRAQLNALAENTYAAKRYELQQQAQAGNLDAIAKLGEMDKMIAATMNSPSLQKAIIKTYSGFFTDPDVQGLYLVSPKAVNNMMSVKHSANTSLELLTKDADTYLKLYSQSHAMGYQPGVKSIKDLLRLKADYQKSLDSKLDSAASEMDVVDESTKDYTSMQQSLRNSRDSLQSFINLGVAPLTKTFNKLAGVEEGASSLLPGDAAGREEKSFIDRVFSVFSGRSPFSSRGVAPTTPGAFNRGTNAGVNVFSDIQPGGASGTRYQGTGGADGVIKAVREMIAGVESEGNYNILVGGRTGPLTGMTLAQIHEMQLRMEQPGAGYASSAVGRYQFVRTTLLGVAKQLGLDPSTAFDERVQDALADRLIKNCGFDQYITGKISKERFMYNLSTQWAALPKDATSASYWGGVGVNRAMARITWEKALASFQLGGESSGPKTGYQVTLHGREAYIPLNARKAIAIELPGLDDALKVKTNMFAERSSRLESIIRLGNEQLNLTNQLLKLKA